MTKFGREKEMGGEGCGVGKKERSVEVTRGSKAIFEGGGSAVGLGGKNKSNVTTWSSESATDPSKTFTQALPSWAVGKIVKKTLNAIGPGSIGDCH